LPIGWQRRDIQNSPMKGMWNLYPAFNSDKIAQLASDASKTKNKGAVHFASSYPLGQTCRAVRCTKKQRNNHQVPFLPVYFGSFGLVVVLQIK
jgi:hypothetical protein